MTPKQRVGRMITRLFGETFTIRLNFRRRHRRWPDLRNPRTFSEKIAWRKIHDRDERMQLYVDKVEVKPIVAAIIGEEHIIPTLAVFDRVEDVSLDFPMPFVVKASHASTTNLFIRSEADKAGAIETLRNYLAVDQAGLSQEWAYRIKPRLLIEPMISVNGAPPDDFKFHVFGGKVFAAQVDVGRFTEHRRAFYSPEWGRLDFTLLYPAAGPVSPPASLPKMIELAERIGGQFSYARVDFYEGPLFGEVTFYPGTGYEPFDPPEWDRKFGDQWPLKMPGEPRPPAWRG